MRRLGNAAVEKIKREKMRNDIEDNPVMADRERRDVTMVDLRVRRTDPKVDKPEETMKDEGKCRKNILVVIEFPQRQFWDECRGTVTRSFLE